MYQGGPKWRPPILNFKVHGMPESDEEEDDDFAILKAHHEKKKTSSESKSGFQPIGFGSTSHFGMANPIDRELEQWEPKHETKSDERHSPEHKNHKSSDDKMPRAQRAEFESGLRTLVPIRELIGDLMALCLEQSDYASEIVEDIKVGFLMSHWQ